jgi:hypothetical protein
VSWHVATLVCGECNAAASGRVLVTDEGTFAESSFLVPASGWAPRLPAYASPGARFHALCPDCVAALGSGVMP